MFIIIYAFIFNFSNFHHVQDQCTALLKACQNKHVSVAKGLCQRNYIDVNAPNKVFWCICHGKQPMHYVFNSL